MNDTETPTASVVLITWAPTERRLEVLKQSLESLHECTEYPYNLIVVDNGPQEQTEWLLQQNFYRHILNPVNKGVGAARNQGAEHAHSDYVAFVDNDILYFPGWLTECIRALRLYSDRKLVATIRKPTSRKHHVGNLDDYWLLNRAPGQALVFRRSDFDNLGWWSTCSRVGNEYCNRMRHRRYQYIWHPGWQRAKHLCKHASYDYRKKLINGVWT